MMVNFFRRPVFETPAWGILIPLFSLGILFAFIGEDVRISRVVYSLIDKSSIEVSHKELSYSTTYGV